MSDSELLQIIRNINTYVLEKGVDIFKIGLVGGGEPLIHFESIKKLVDSVKQNEHIIFYIISNGYSISEEQLEYCYDNMDNLTLNFSLDGYQEIHDLNRVDHLGNGTFDKVMASIKKYEDVFSQKPPVNCTITPKHIENSGRVIDFFVKNGFETVTFSQIFDNPALVVTNEEFSKFLDEASKYLILRQKRLPISYDCSKYGKFCGVGITNPYYSGGKVYPCGRFSGNDKYLLGNSGDSLDMIEKKMQDYKHDSRKFCYYDMMNEKGEL